MDIRTVVEGKYLEIDTGIAYDEAYDDLCHLCQTVDPDSINRIVITGDCSNPDLPLFLSVINVYYPHIIVEAMMGEIPSEKLVHYVWENDLDVEWWIKI